MGTTGSTAAGSFVHLHNHTEYSMLDGAAKVSPMLEEAKRLEMPAIGMTDHGNMFGASEFYNAAVKADITPIIGIEAYIAPGSRFDPKRITWGDPSQKSDDVSASGAYLHMTMVAENATGLRNLFKLSSLASFEGQLGKWPRMDAEIIAEHFDPETLEQMTGIQLPTAEEKQALEAQAAATMAASQQAGIMGQKLWRRLPGGGRSSARKTSSSNSWTTGCPSRPGCAKACSRSGARWASRRWPPTTATT